MGIIGMLRQKRPDFIPVVDLGVDNNPNRSALAAGPVDNLRIVAQYTHK